MPKERKQSSGAMPRCYMVKKGAPRANTEPTLSSPTEASAAPPTYGHPEEYRANTEISQNAEAPVEYAELRSAPISERSAADTEAAHDLLSLAAGLPPLAPATLYTMLGRPEPLVPVFAYSIQPSTIYFVTETPPEPIYQRTIPPLTPLPSLTALQPMQQLQPLQSLQTLKPLQPMQQVQPLQPLQQVQPLQSLQPLQQVQPLQPLQQVQPLQPLQQVQPLQMLQQVQTLQQVQPVQPLQTLQPLTTQPLMTQPLTTLAPQPPTTLPPMPPLHPMPRFTDRPRINYAGYPGTLPPMPPLQYHPPQPQVQNNSLQTVVVENESVVQSGTLTTLTIEEVTTDSEPEQMFIYEELDQVSDEQDQIPIYKSEHLTIYETDGESVPQQQNMQVQPSEIPVVVLDDSDDDDAVTIVSVKEKVRFDCKECGKSYATSSNLSRHKQTHRSLDSTSAKKCEECGKAYVSMPALAMHVLTHRMGHVCGVCGKLFSRPWLLRGHVRSHTGEKPYSCVDCGKSFADRSNLRAHLQTHSSDKKYECPRCNKIFALKSYLGKHMEVACTAAGEEGAAA